MPLFLTIWVLSYARHRDLTPVKDRRSPDVRRLAAPALIAEHHVTEKSGRLVISICIGSVTMSVLPRLHADKFQGGT